jgi:hypothetical protein
MIIENLEFNGSSDILQYIPTVPDDQPELIKEEIKAPQIQMDFSTPISDVVPSAEFNMPESNYPPTTGGPYKNPQNNRVSALSLDNADAAPSKKNASKNPFGLTDEQLHAAIAGIAAVATFSKPVQTKLGSVVPKFIGDHGDLSLPGMIASALVAAIIYFMFMKILRNNK